MVIPVRSRRVAAFAVLAAAASTLAVTPTAVAAPGDNGDVKIHAADAADDAKVCEFYLTAFNFDTIQQVAWTIESQPLVPNVPTRTGTLTLQTGAGATAPIRLPDGRYKLTWSIVGSLSAGKEKVFRVDCPDDPATPPNGGPPVGGGGLARDDAFTPVAGAAGVGLAAVGAVAWLRFRRRADGPAA